MPIDEATILIEAADEPRRGNDRVSRGEGSLVTATESVQDAMGRVRRTGETVRTELRSMSQQPSKDSVQFGVKVTGEAQLVVAKAARARRTSP